jgi:hypothetical protein
MNEPPSQPYCAFHPNVETSLRCNRCDRPICSKCAVRTPTGYRCKECVRGQQKVFETAQTIDYPISFVVAAVLSFLGSLIAPRMGFFVLLLAPLAGTITAEAVRFAIRRRRSERVFLSAAAGALLGSLPQLLDVILQFDLISLIWHGIYTATVTSTVYYQLRGLVFRR